VNFATTFTEGGVVGTTTIDLTANIWPTTKVDLTSGVASPTTTVGFSYTAQTFDLIRSGAKVEAVAIGNEAPPLVSATATSLARQRLVLSNLPDEELIVVVGSTGARSVTLQYDELPADAPTIDHDVTVKVVDAATKKVEFIDTATGTSRATRILDDEGIAEALSLQIDLNGQFANGDLFHIADNADGIGDGRTLLKILDAQSSSIDGSGGFQNTFNIMVSRLGARVESGNLARDAAESLRDASVTAEAAYTGVNLDTEASNLIQQQQAYQASARILSTARELFNTLLDMV
jgi:flagellar hook-associated protein 1 FlgK